MRLLVTGATGFVGNVLLDLVPRAVAGSKITLLVLPGDPGTARLAAKKITGVRFVEGDITNSSDVDGAVRGHTHVIHLAGLISYWGRDKARLVSVNQHGVENVVSACLRHDVDRLVHVSSVGAIGCRHDGTLAEEDTPFNWPKGFHYMATKHAGQQVVQRAVREQGLRAIVLNPASLMGPGDPDPLSPHNQLYAGIYFKRLFGCFSGGLAVADVRDLAGIIIKALAGGKIGEKYLVVGANLPYTRVVQSIGDCFQTKVYPFRVPSFLLTAVGASMELASLLTGKRPPLTRAYGRLSGWYGYYSNRKSVEAFAHRYLPFTRTVADACAYFRENYVSPTAPAA
jgi:dihydroflavonol-4-reductase